LGKLLVAKFGGGAIETLIDIRREQGVVVTDETKSQWVLISAPEGISVDYCGDGYVKIELLFPCFSTQEAAQRAIAKYGRQRLREVMDLMHGIQP
jgi:hypothetical protein